MTRVKFLPIPENTDPVSYETSLPTDSPIAIYYRQSTDAQVGNISTTLQTVDMVKYLQRQGWAEEKIIMIDMDAGVSGTKKIDERKGMSEVFRLITSGKIAAVCCQDEDRLFRDVTQIQVNIFIEACRVHNVRVITPTMVYHFSHELMGSFHAKQFRYRCEMAADYITTVVKGKLLRAKQSLAMNGQWAGGTIPVGFMVDLRKTLPNGSRNEYYKKYVLFEPYAMVVREYFRLYRQYSGNLAQTLHHIHKHGPYYPDPSICLPPEGFKVHYTIGQNVHGWCPRAKQSLVFTFTNAAYIGHWVVKDMVIRWHNHPPIVDEATFYFAFNRHCSFNLDGSENTEYRSIRFNVRPTLDAERGEERPLLVGLVFSTLDGKEKLVGTHWRDWKQECSWSNYRYTLIKDDGFGTRVWSKEARYFDSAVVDLLLSKLQLTFDFQKWEEDVNASMQETEAESKLKKAQLTQLETVMENLVTSLASLTTPQLIAAVEKKYQDAEAERDRLNQEVAMLSAHVADVESIKRVRDMYQTVVDDWAGSTRHMQREILHSFIEKVVANKVPNTERFHLIIHWRDGSKDEIDMYRTAGHGMMWLPKDTKKLIELADAGASQLEIMEAFPDVTWRSLYHKYRRMTKTLLQASGDHFARWDESYHDYVKRIGDKKVTSESGSRVA